ncbi:MAG: sigma-54 dependent transcriptional regulator [Candidatus Omnitrophota bacterium]
MDKKILIVDDDRSLQEVLKIRLLKYGYQTVVANDGREGIEKVKQEKPDLILLDVMLPDADGTDLLKQIKEIDKDLSVIVMTAIGTMPIVIKAMKEGAYDYISKPFDGEQLCILIQKAFEVQALKQELRHLKSRLTQKRESEVIIGTSRQMQEIYKTIARISDKKVTVIIRGESGTGKELIARAIHSNSQRQGAFVAVDCASLSPTLLESELFGHEKGSFTGATYDRIGRFEEANNGSLFLDEIGNLNLETQAKLLRVLQENEVRRVGGKSPIKVDIRIIAATNVDLEEIVAKGSFREDLYHRLNVIPILLPSLKERKADISLLVTHFLKQMALKFNEPVKQISPKAEEYLYAYDWPGNVRELLNAVEHAVITSKGSLIMPEDLPKNIIENKARSLARPLSPDKGLGLDKAVDDFERTMIVDALEKNAWVQTEAARLLGIDRKVLKYKMDKLEIKKP